MDKKKKLLEHYADYCFRNIKYFFPQTISMFDIKKLKDDINEDNKVTTEKEKIDNIFMTNIGEYLGTKFNIMKNNLTFLGNRHEEFDLDYEVADKLLWFHNYKTKRIEVDIVELRDDFDINDCKKVIFDFYNDLLGDNPNDVAIVDYLLNNKVNIIYNRFERGITDGNKNINLSYTNDLNFLIVLVHEISHAFAFSKTSIPIGCEDVRNVEAESYFIEKLFIKYLRDKKLPIFKDDNRVRCINDEDIEKYFLVSYSEILSDCYSIVDERDIIKTIDDDNIIDKDFVRDYLCNSPYEYNYIIQSKFVNDIFDNYMLDEVKNLDYHQLKEIEKDGEIYMTGLINSYEGHIRYLISRLLSWYFVDIYDDERQIKKFKDFIRQKRDYSSEEFAYLFNLELDDALAIETNLYDKYRKIAPKYNIEVTSNLKIPKDYISDELKYYNKLINRTKKCDDKNQEEMIIVKKMFDLFDTSDVGLDMYPFRIEYQVDDCDVEKYEEYKKRILELRKSDK